MLCKIRGFYGGDYEEWRLLGCYAVWPQGVTPQKTPFFTIAFVLDIVSCDVIVSTSEYRVSKMGLVVISELGRVWEQELVA
jgi:hypothetical protein